MKVIERRPNGSKRVYTINDEPSKTDPSFQKDCDVNEIMRKMLKGQAVTHLAKYQGSFEDVSNIPDLDQALEQVSKAQAAFDELPATLRRRFGNSPVEMVNFLADPDNYDESVKLGLRTRPKVGPGSENPAEAAGRQFPNSNTPLPDLKSQNPYPSSHSKLTKSQKLQNKKQSYNNDDDSNDDDVAK